MMDDVPDGVPEPVYSVDSGDADVTGAIKGRRRLRNQLLGAALLGGLSVGVSVMSCVGQSFSLRQARALEAIQHALEGRCTAGPLTPTPTSSEASR